MPFVYPRWLPLATADEAHHAGVRSLPTGHASLVCCSLPPCRRLCCERAYVPVPMASEGTLAEPLPNMDAVLPVSADSTTVLTAVLLLTFQSPAKRSPEPAACPPVCSGVDNAARGHPGGVSVFNGLKRRADRGGCGGSVLGIRRSKVGCARHRAKLPHSAPPSPIASSRPLMIVEAHRQRTALSTQPPEAESTMPPRVFSLSSFPPTQPTLADLP